MTQTSKTKAMAISRLKYLNWMPNDGAATLVGVRVARYAHLRGAPRGLQRDPHVHAWRAS